MSSVLDRDELSASPLADLHVLANEFGVDGFRRLRKADLVEAIIARQSGEAPAADADPEVEAEAEAVASEGDEEAGADGADDEAADDAPRQRRRRGGRTRARTRSDDAVDRETAPAARAEAPAAEAPATEDGERTVQGVVELLANGSGFVRLNHPEVSDDDVYVSAAQVKRCELVSGDAVSGPVRPPRRSERHASLVRVETINGRPADEVS